MATIDVRGNPTAEGWRFTVTVTEGQTTTRHEVTLRRPDYERLTDGRVPPDELLRESFAYLLEREPQQAILRAFDLTIIGRYFPEFEREIKARLGRGSS